MTRSESFVGCFNSFSEDSQIKALKILNMDKTILKELGFSDTEVTLLRGFTQDIDSIKIFMRENFPDQRVIKFNDGSEISFDASNATNVRSK